MSDVPIFLTVRELDTLRQAVMEVVLAPAADVAASCPEDAEAAEEVREAAALLSRIGWPGEAVSSAVEIPARDIPDARRAMLLLISGALEGAWEAATSALDDADDWGELRDALTEVDSAGCVLRRLDSRRVAEPESRRSAGARAGRVGPAATDAGGKRYDGARRSVVG
jgi:hypothetical protein